MLKNLTQAIQQYKLIRQDLLEGKGEYRQTGSVIVNNILDRIYKQNKNFMAIWCGDTGCQPKGSKVLMANGEWKNIENIKIGDLVLSPQQDRSYKFSKVKNITKWFSKKNYDIKRINRDKRKLYTCSNNHLIPLYYNQILRKNGKRLYKNHKWIIKNYRADHYNAIAVEQKQHRYIGFSSFLIKEFKDRKNCEIEPYTLGVFLGDGHFSSNRYKKGLSRQIGITTSDFSIIKEVSKYYNIMNTYKKPNNKAKTYYFSLKSKLAEQLINLKLEGKKSGNKFIPKSALLSNLLYRKKLLAGLIDTDGYYKSGGYEFILKSKNLIKNIEFLVYSLGGRVNSIKKVEKGYEGFKGKYYRMTFYIGKLRLPLKTKRKIRDIKTGYLSSNRISITCRKSKKQMVYGFELNSKSGWYITDNFMVTHNSGKSYSAISTAEQLDPYFTINQVVFDTKSFMNLLNNPAMVKGRVIVYDECGVGVPARSWYSQSNKLFNYIAQTFRNKNLIVFFTTPHFTFLDSQTRKLLHGSFTPFTIDKSRGIAKVKAYMLQTNPTIDKTYYHKFSRYNKETGERVKISYAHIHLPSKHLLRAYELKKTEFTNKLNKNVLFDITEDTKPIVNQQELTDFESNIKEDLMLGTKVSDLCDKYGRHKKNMYDIIKNISKKVGFDLLNSSKVIKQDLNNRKT